MSGPDDAWLAAELDRLLDFAEGSRHPDGGFAWLDDAGRPELDRPIEAWITCRMTHVFSLGHLLGRPGAAALADHGVAALEGGVLRDPRHGGWYASATATGPVGADKRAYEHAFVVLAASSAAAAGRPGAEDLLATALDVVETRFWRDADGLLVDVWDRTWTDLEPYRGVNANMHGVEAFLAAADVTGDVRWRERAARVTERVVHGWAREGGWHLPEHFDAAWRPLPGYNTEDRAHPFRPYGVTIGHLLEWSRLALHVRAATGVDAPGWLLDDAVHLFDTAVREGWAVDGREGFVYTVDWDGTPVVRDRLHWVVAEAIAAAATLHQVTGERRFAEWAATWWDHAERLFVDRAGGSWRHELDPANRPAASVWAGKPDAYHAVQATLLPRLPPAPSLASALARGLLG
ncbi:MAG TPA: AGE family epimerase/isomerase [Jiangellales bacterium]|nr:AGE family epimerase/isomerase [Jiangellales bacterium]